MDPKNQPQTPPNRQVFFYPIYITMTQDVTLKIQRFNRFSYASMILGILGILSSCSVILGGIFGVLGLIFGIIGLARQKSGRFASSGLVLGIIGITISGVSLLLTGISFILMPALILQWIKVI